MLTVDSLSRSANSFKSDGDTVSARKREEALVEKNQRIDEKQREQEAQVEVEERSCRMLTVESLSRSANPFRSDSGTVSARKREEALSERKNDQMRESESKKREQK
jgi:hypothetical protein